ncbi:hypothetical protein EV2_045174 [Malus domestica]
MPRTQSKNVVSLLVTQSARHIGLVVFRVNILACPVGPSAKAMKFMAIETRSVKKKTVMGKSTTNLPVQNPRQDGLPQAHNPSTTVTLEATSATRRENEVNLGGQTRDTKIPTKMTKGIFVEGLVENCDEDNGEACDLPIRSFLRRRL